MTEFVLSGGCLGGAGLRCRAAIGAGGITRDKREGDGATPAGLLRLTRILYRADRLPPPRTVHPTEPIAPGDGWCDDPLDRFYNRPVSTTYAGRHEALWRKDPLYDLIGVLDWNFSPVTPHRGSAIFLHPATTDYAPTEGCIALSLPDLLACLAAGLTAIRVGG